MTRATLSTHVLDIALGRPARGVGVALVGEDGSPIGQGTTGSDGRIADLCPGGVAPGSYRLVFEVEDYFGDREHLFNAVSLDLEIREARHHHVPLLIGPYACSSYRGS
ncbi:MAG TPA: hydroxyisourate hydrolase [Candidatus Limnocylindrales bacterium]|nr:hydroxyisourate hydrolase [Candidatus Limnocylindrales bacterium]